MMEFEAVVRAFKATESASSPSPQVIAVSKKDDPDEPQIPDVLSILPVRGMVVFPGTVVPLSIRRASSLKMLDETLPKTKIIALFTQKNEESQTPTTDELYPVGVAGNVLKLIRQSDDVVLILVQALRRIRAKKFVMTDPYFRCEVELLESIYPKADPQWEARVKNLREAALQLLDLTPDAPEQARLMLINITDAGLLADYLASNMNAAVHEKQHILEELDVDKRVALVQQRLSAQLEIARLQQKLQQDVASQISDSQRR